MDTNLNSNLESHGILKLTLNRPTALNALNQTLMEELYQALQQAKNNPEIKAVLLHGEGKAFCAGADVKQLAPLEGTNGYAFAKRGQEIFNTLETLGKPSLAAIHGFALGGGCELAMAASMRLASENALFGQPEIKLGIIPGFGGTQRLSRLVGKGRAIEMCLTGRLINAAEALNIGLITEVVPEASLMERAIVILQNLTQLPSFALTSMLEVINHGYDLNLTDALELEATHFGLCCNTQDKNEGVKAFIEKRAPQFTGK
ncbi:MAG TPA: enoyl-CoA hydratase-related protein [Gammaproteobacteria bacterium]|nr:enoyl-CoA hydratase-related protein [Gammaproteobacteria bacterium]